MSKPPRILSIAGSDPSGGAGLQADIKTITALGAYAMTAVTSLTVQNTQGVQQVEAVAPALAADQIKAVLEDIGIDVVKIGLLPNGAVAEVVLDILQNIDVPIVLDPVGVSGTGHSLQDESAAAALLASGFVGAIITPNLTEASALSGMPVEDEKGMVSAGLALLEKGASVVLVTGGHLQADEVVDLRLSKEGARRFADQRIETTAGHGTGCTLSSAMAVGLAEGKELDEAILSARAYVRHGLETAPGFGKGLGPLNHLKD